MVEEERKKYLNEQEAEWLREFAQAFSDGIIGGGHIFTPSLVNQNLTRLNNNPLVPDYDKLVDALNKAVKKADNLQAYQEWMELAEMTFKRTLEYYSTMLSFDLSYTCINIDNKEDYKSPKYKKDKKAVEDFLCNFNYKQEFQKVVKQMMRSETSFMWFRNNSDKKNPHYTLQLMPQDYCLITGVWEKGLLYD